MFKMTLLNLKRRAHGFQCRDCADYREMLGRSCGFCVKGGDARLAAHGSFPPVRGKRPACLRFIRKLEPFTFTKDGGIRRA